MPVPLRAIALVLAVVVSVGYWLYKRSLPRPLPGLPYSKVAGARPFGDIPDIIKAPEPLQFFLGRCHELEAPIFQVFLEPFGRPTVVVVDPRE